MGGRAKVAEKCLPRLVTAVLKALRASMVAAGCGLADGVEDGSWTLSSVETGTALEEPEPWAREAATDEEQIVRDQATGLPLDPKLVQAAREEGCAYMAELEVMKPSSMDECLAETGRRPVPCRWVDIERGRPESQGAQQAGMPRNQATVDYRGRRLDGRLCGHPSLRSLSDAGVLGLDRGASQ